MVLWVEWCVTREGSIGILHNLKMPIYSIALICFHFFILQLFSVSIMNLAILLATSQLKNNLCIDRLDNKGL